MIVGSRNRVTLFALLPSIAIIAQFFLVVKSFFERTFKEYSRLGYD
jgi:hypothetical protein